MAIRTLAGVWADRAVDSGAACWLIDEVLKTGPPESQVEAAGLLEIHADQLAGLTKGVVEWPNSLLDRWPTYLPADARVSIIFALGEAQLSRPKDWWQDRMMWVMALLDEVLVKDEDPTLRGTAALMLRPLLRLKPENNHETVDWGGTKRAYELLEHVWQSSDTRDHMLAQTS